MRIASHEGLNRVGAVGSMARERERERVPRECRESQRRTVGRPTSGTNRILAVSRVLRYAILEVTMPCRNWVGAEIRVSTRSKRWTWPSLLALGFRVSGFGLRVSGFEFRVSGFGLRASGTGLRASGFGGFRVSNFGFRVSGSGIRVRDFGFRDSGSGFRVQGFGFRVSGFGFRASGFGLRASGGFGFRVSG